MKLLILTTKTEHHKYFVNKLEIDDSKLFTIYETKKNKFSFNTKHKFFIKRNKIEKLFFANKKFSRKIKKKYFYDVNSQSSINYILKINPKIIISFGTGLIKKNFLEKFKKKIKLNLHGGNPEFYRGLDSHLWSIYHNDFGNLETTLHKIDSKFDTGDILYSKKIKKTKKITFNNLRIINTQNCIDLVNKLHHEVSLNKKLKFRKLKLIGRYYSAIPSVLINRCRKNFQKWIK